MSGMNDSLLAEYMVGRYRQGFDYSAMYLAATLFERLVGIKLKQKNPQRYEEISKDRSKTLNDVIKAIRDQMGLNNRYNVSQENLLYYKEVFRSHSFFEKDGRKISNARDAYDKLRDFKDIRNDIIHAEHPEGLLNDKEREIMDLMLYVASEYSPKLFRDILSKIHSRDTVGLRNILDGISADYLVRSVDEVMIKRFDQAEGINRKTWKIEDADFSNLFQLRKKLVPLKNTLEKWLAENYPKLTTTILTTIDTASAYIWLPIVHRDNNPKDVDRPNLESATVSILATPLDLRIYIDFGGQCFPDRKEYFKFIRKPDGEFRNFIANLDDIEKVNFSIFDVEWYSFIRNTRDVDSILNNWDAWEETVNEADRELNDLGKNPIITTNRLLSGFIFDRNWIKLNSPLKETFFLEKLSQIIELYYTLLLHKIYNREKS